jgi:hypothetical protein
MNKVYLAFLSALVFAALSSGAVYAEGKLPFDLKPTCNASLEFGDIVKGYDKNYGVESFSNVWMQKTIIGFGVQAIFRAQDTLRVAAEMKMFNEYPRKTILGATRRLYHYPYVREAQVIHDFINNDVVDIIGGIGYYPYKYNENVRNLGEYLFRSTIYPQTLSTEFDYPYARLLGGYLKTTLLNQISCDILIASNQEYMAVHDINLAILGAWQPGRILEIGGGIYFGSIISADSNKTSPKDDVTWGYIDTVNGKPVTKFYSFAGKKLMARMAFDPKYLFSSNGLGGLFGENDLKIYAEAALLGTDNYPRAFNQPVWYMNPLQRIPVMFGFNVPTFKVLDILNLEAEWWGNPYANSLEGVVMDGAPLPFRPSNDPVKDSLIYKNDNWKWSIYVKKTFASHYNVTIQAASDHMRTFALDYYRQDWEESLRGPSNWCFTIKLGALF